MPELPGGTVTFLFTDIEGSTQLLHELGDAYADALAEHRRALREAFARHDGVEVDTQGDAFFIAFGRAKDAPFFPASGRATTALAAAAEGQRAPGPGQIGIPRGSCPGGLFVSEEGSLGFDVHRPARLAGAGPGGEVMVSRRTADLVGADD